MRRAMEHVHLRWAAAATGARWEVLGPDDQWVPLQEAGKRSSRAELRRCVRVWARASGVRLEKSLELDILHAAPSGTSEQPRTKGKDWPRSWRQVGLAVRGCA